MMTLTIRLALLATAAAGANAPVQKKAVVPPARPVAGTAQLPGDNGKLGQAYTMGKAEKLNVVLTGARYGKVRWIYGKDWTTPGSDQKLLILSYQVQNPNKIETQMDGRALQFTAIDEENQNYSDTGSAILKNRTTTVNVGLKPAQRIDCESVILVPAKATIPKLMVAHRTGGPVLRYDMHGKIALLAKPYSEDGTAALASVPGVAGTAYPLLTIDARYVSAAFQEGSVGDVSADAKHVFMVPKVAVKVQTPVSLLVWHGVVAAEAVDENGDRYQSDQIFKASADDVVNEDYAPGDERTIRFRILVPKGVKIVKLRLWEIHSTGILSSAVEIPLDVYATIDGQPLKKPF